MLVMFHVDWCTIGDSMLDSEARRHAASQQDAARTIYRWYRSLRYYREHIRQLDVRRKYEVQLENDRCHARWKIVLEGFRIIEQHQASSKAANALLRRLLADDSGLQEKFVLLLQEDQTLGGLVLNYLE